MCLRAVGCLNLLFVGLRCILVVPILAHSYVLAPGDCAGKGANLTYPQTPVHIQHLHCRLCRLGAAQPHITCFINTINFTALFVSMQVFEGRVVENDNTRSGGHVITATAGSGASKQTFNYSTERVVGNGSFGTVFQATCLETAETVRFLQWYMNRSTCQQLQAGGLAGRA